MKPWDVSHFSIWYCHISRFWPFYQAVKIYCYCCNLHFADTAYFHMFFFIAISLLVEYLFRYWAGCHVLWFVFLSLNVKCFLYTLDHSSLLVMSFERGIFLIIYNLPSQFLDTIIQRMYVLNVKSVQPTNNLPLSYIFSVVNSHCLTKGHLVSLLFYLLRILNYSLYFYLYPWCILNDFYKWSICTEICGGSKGDVQLFQQLFTVKIISVTFCCLYSSVTEKMTIIIGSNSGLSILFPSVACLCFWKCHIVLVTVAL